MTTIPTELQRRALDCMGTIWLLCRQSGKTYATYLNHLRRFYGEVRLMCTRRVVSLVQVTTVGHTLHESPASINIDTCFMFSGTVPSSTFIE